MYQGIITAVVLLSIGYTAGCYSAFAIPKAHAEATLPMTVQDIINEPQFLKTHKFVSPMPLKVKK